MPYDCSSRFVKRATLCLVCTLGYLAGDRPSLAQTAPPTRFASVCSGASVKLPIVQRVTAGTVDPLLGLLAGAVNTVLGGLVGNINTNVADVFNGQPIGLNVLDRNGNLLTQSNCAIAASEFAVNNDRGISLGGGVASGLGGNGGALATAGAASAIAIGNGAVTAPTIANAIALGSGANASADGALALGANAQAAVAGSVAIGNGSVASATVLESGSLLTGSGPVGLGFNTLLATSTGAVSVGSATARRQIRNLADGSAPSDAATVSQVGQVATSTNTALATIGGQAAGTLGGGAAYNSTTGQLSAPSYAFAGGTAFGDVGSALLNLDGRVVTNTTGLASLTSRVNASVGLVVQPLPNGTITVGGAVGGGLIDIGGSAGPRRLLGLSDGSIAAGSTEAITGGQLYQTNAAVTANVDAIGSQRTLTGVLGTQAAARLGGGAVFDALTGSITAPAYVFAAGTSFGDVGSALLDLDGRVVSHTTALNSLSDRLSGVEPSLVRQISDQTITVASGLAGGLVDLTGVDGVRRMTGLMDGALSATSIDAVTGAQLFATNADVLANTQALSVEVSRLDLAGGRLASAIGGGAVFDAATGGISAPTYTFASGTAFGDVGSALLDLDGRSVRNATAIDHLTNQLNDIGPGLVQQAPNETITIAAALRGSVVDIAGASGMRRLTGLSDGVLSDTSTDAVTGSQLFTTNGNVAANARALVDEIARADLLGSNLVSALGGGATFDAATGALREPRYFLDGRTVGNVEEAFTDLDGRVVDLRHDVSTLQQGVGSVASLLKQKADGTIEIGQAVGGHAVSFYGSANDARVLQGVASGLVTAASSEAINGSQLAATNEGLVRMASALGGGAVFNNATSAFSEPSYQLDAGSTTATNVGEAVANLDARTRANALALANLSQAGGGTPGPGTDPAQNSFVRQASTGSLMVGDQTDGTVVEFNSKSGRVRRLTGVAAGSLAAGSSDAVTGGQVAEMTNSIASAMGGGMAMDAAGQMTAPTYSIRGRNYNSVGTAFAAIDGDVGDLQNEVARIGKSSALIYTAANSSGAAAIASGEGSVAVGGDAVAGERSASAFGESTRASGVGATAIGAGSSAHHTNASAFGASATTTRDNQVALGTETNTYTLAGINSNSSRAAQSGPLEVVTSDASGNLGTVPISSFFSRVDGLEAEFEGINRNLNRQSDGIAIAMALGGINLPDGKDFALGGNVGFYDGTTAFGVGAIGQLTEGVYLNGGVGLGTKSSTVAGRAGMTLAW